MMDVMGLWGGAGVGLFCGLAHMVLLVYYFGCKKRHLLYKPDTDSNNEHEQHGSDVVNELPSPPLTVVVDAVVVDDEIELDHVSTQSAHTTTAWLPGVPGYKAPMRPAPLALTASDATALTMVGVHCMLHTFSLPLPRPSCPDLDHIR